MSSNTGSPTKVTAQNQRQTVSTRTIRQKTMQDASPFTKRNTKNSLALASDLDMNMEELELLEDFGYNSKLKKIFRSRLESLQISKQKLQHLIEVLAKEPHEKTNKDIEEFRKILQEVPFIQQYVTKNEVNLSHHDINDLSKLLIYQRLEPGEEIQLHGEESHQMFIILKGKVALARPIKNKRSAPIEELGIEGTFQTQMKMKGAKRGKIAKGETQVTSDPVKSSQVMFNGIACRFLVTVDVADENGNIQKVKQPHPIYNEVAEMQRVLESMKFKTLQTPAFKEKLDQTIMQTAKVTASEQAFKQKMESTISARKIREEDLVLKRSMNESGTRQFTATYDSRTLQPTHESHLHAHQLHMERLRAEEDHIQQTVFHNKPTIITQNDKSFQLMQKTGSKAKNSMKNSINTVESESQDLDIGSHKENSVQLFQSEAESKSVTLAIAGADPFLVSESSLNDSDLPIEYDEQDYPTEEIFDYLESGQYFGQLSLSENSRGKRASVYTKTTTHIIIIERIAFQKMLVLHQKRHEAELLTFLKTIPLFKSFPNSQLKKLVCYFNPVNKIVNSYLYRENEPSTHVYIVKEGEFRVTRRVQKQQRKNEPDPQEVYADPRKSTKGQSKYFVKNIANHYKNVELQKIGKSQLIGDEDCAMSNKYNTTVQCISQQAKLIVITREDFRRIESQGAQWNCILSNGEQKIRKYHDKMRQYQFIMLHNDDEMNKAKAVAGGQQAGANKYIAGEDLLKQHWDSVKRPSGEMVENPLFQSSRLEVNVEQLISRRAPQQILQIKPESKIQNLRSEQQAVQFSALTNYDKIKTLQEPIRERKISTAMPNARRPPLQTKLLGTHHKANAFSQVFDKYLSPNSGGASQAVQLTNPNQKVARNSKGFSTADTMQSLNTRKLQTTAYLKLKDNFKTRSRGQSQSMTKNIKYSISWNLSPTQKQPPQPMPINLNNVI